MAKDILQNPNIPGFRFPNASFGSVISEFFTLAYLLVGFLSFIWFVWGAFQYILARGNKEELAHARARIIWAIAGLVIFILSYTITQFAEEIIKPKTATPFSLVPVAYAEVNIGQEFGFGDITTLGGGLGRIVIPAFSIAIALVTVFFLIGAFKILKSAGDKNEVQSGRDLITHSIIGFVLLMAAFLIFNFVIARLFGINDVNLIEGIR